MYEYKLSDSVVKDTRLSGSGIHSLGKPNYHFSFDRLDILVRFSEMLPYKCGSHRAAPRLYTYLCVSSRVYDD
jgi:hypothetical protein